VPATEQVSVGAATSEGTLASLGKKALAWDTKSYSVVDASGKKIKAPSTAGDKITITSITPGAGSTLRTGHSATFDLKVDYEVRSAEAGRVIWGISRAGDLQTILSSTVIQKGKSTLASSRTIQILPEHGTEPSMFVLLLPKGLLRSTAFDRKSFRAETLLESDSATLPQINVNVTGELEDRLKIVSVSPSLAMPLRGGETVDFQISLEYEIGSVDAAEVFMTFGTYATFAEVRIPTYAQDTHIIEKGRGSLTLTRRLWIPTGLKDAFPITARLIYPASATDNVTYKVAP
jgi:hypothetical protein